MKNDRQNTAPPYPNFQLIINTGDPKMFRADEALVLQKAISRQLFAMGFMGTVLNEATNVEIKIAQLEKHLQPLGS